MMLQVVKDGGRIILIKVTAISHQAKAFMETNKEVDNLTVTEGVVQVTEIGEVIVEASAVTEAEEVVLMTLAMSKMMTIPVGGVQVATMVAIAMKNHLINNLRLLILAIEAREAETVAVTEVDTDKKIVVASREAGIKLIKPSHAPKKVKASQILCL